MDDASKNRRSREDHVVSFREKICYGLGDSACNVVYGLCSTLLTFFYTDYVGINAFVVGMIFLITRLFDGVSDIIMGFIIVTIIVISSAASTGGITSTTIDTVESQSDAARFLQPGDKIVGINGTTVHIKRDISFELGQYSGEGECELKYKRDGKVYTEKFTPMQTTLEDGTPYYYVGFTVKQNSINPLSVLHEGFYQTIWMVKLVFVSLGMLLTGGASVTDLSGPVGVVSAMSTVAKTGLADFIFFAGFLAVNIGVMNLLPLPALDGGRILFVLIEMIFRKPIPRDKEGYVHFIGFLLLIGLMLFATWNDIVRLLSGFFG